MESLGLGYFEDEYAKLGGQWKFAKRYHTFDGLDSKLYLRTFMGDSKYDPKPEKYAGHEL